MPSPYCSVGYARVLSGRRPDCLFVSGSVPKIAEIAFRHHPLALFAGMLDAIFKFACAKRKLGGDVVAAPRRVHAAWRVVLDRLPDPKPMIIHRGSPLELMI